MDDAHSSPEKLGDEGKRVYKFGEIIHAAVPEVYHRLALGQCKPTIHPSSLCYMLGFDFGLGEMVETL